LQRVEPDSLGEHAEDSDRKYMNKTMRTVTDVSLFPRRDFSGVAATKTRDYRLPRIAMERPDG
jgi:hypothetical protein